MQHIQTQEEWEVEMSIKVLEFVRGELYLDLRFLNAALSELIPQYEKALTTCATDGSYLFFSSEQVLRVFKNNSRYLNKVFCGYIIMFLF